MVQVGVIASHGIDDTGPRQSFTIAARELEVPGFMIGRHAGEFGRAANHLGQWMREGRLATA